MSVNFQLHVPAAFLQVISQCILNRRLDRPQIRSGHYEEEINLLPLSGIEPRFPGRPAYILFTAPVIRIKLRGRILGRHIVMEHGA